MLVYTNKNLNISINFNRKTQYPYSIETEDSIHHLRTLEELLSFMTQKGFTSAIGAKMIEEHIRIAITGCEYFPGRKCRGCSYASDPKQFDPCCLYGSDEALNAVDECLS